MTPKALRGELNWSRSTMDRYLCVVKAMRTSPKTPGPWTLAAPEIELLRAAHRSNVAPRGLARFARRQTAGAQLKGVKQREASISLTELPDLGTLAAMNIGDLLDKAGTEFLYQKAGLHELQAKAAANRLALAGHSGFASSAVDGFTKAASSGMFGEQLSSTIREHIEGLR